MNNKDILNLIYPPKWVAEVLRLFISGAMQGSPKGIKCELIYCVLPIISEDTLREKLNRAKNTSSFYSIFEKNMGDKKEYLLYLSDRIESFMEITKDGLIVLGNDNNLNIDDYITVSKPIKHTKIKSKFDKDYFKAAYYLGQILSKEDYRNIILKMRM